MTYRQGGHVRVSPYDGWQQSLVPNRLCLQQVLDHAELSERSSERSTRIEVGILAKDRKFRCNRKHSVEETAVMSRDVAHDVERLQPRLHLRCRQPEGRSDLVLRASRGESEEAGESAPIQELNGRPHWQCSVILRMVVLYEVLVRLVNRLFILCEPTRVFAATRSRVEHFRLQVRALVHFAQGMSDQGSDVELDGGKRGKRGRAEIGIESIEPHDVTEGGGWIERIAPASTTADTKRVPVSAQAVVVDLAELLNSGAVVTDVHSARREQVHLLFIRLELLDRCRQLRPWKNEDRPWTYK